MSNNSASWLVFELRRTLGAMALFAVAMVFLYSTFFPLNPEYPPPPIVGVIAGVFAAASFRQMFRADVGWTPMQAFCHVGGGLSSPSEPGEFDWISSELSS